MFPVIMDVASLAFTAFSPSKTCKVRVSSTRYRHDPYRARVLTNAFVAASTLLASMPEIIPRAAPTVAPKVVKAIAPLSWSKIVSAPAANTATAPPSPVKAAPKPVAPEPIVTKQDTSKPHYALVGFKHETSMFQAPFRLSVGDVVIVEADRGEHIGVVQEITSVAPKYNVPCRVLRRANSIETECIDSLTTKERATTTAIQKLAESLGLGIRVVDTEFQMDGNKLTVFFASKVFVDFRKLQRGLFRDYRCRIWLVNWNEVRPYTPVAVNACVA